MLKAEILLICVAAFAHQGGCSRMKVGFRMRETLQEKDIRFQKIVGGQDAQEGEFPYQISLQGPFGHNCGGVIVSENVVLTAGHCLRGVSGKNHKVVAGITHLKNFGSHVQTSGILSIHVHPEYTGGVGPNDIAIAVLQTPFRWTRYVQPAYLPENNQEFDGETSLSGWGTTGTNDISIILQKIKLPIISIDDCYNFFYPSNLNKRSNLCTGPINGNVSACSGDSGGPLVKMVHGKPYVIGLVSWGRIPCGKGAPTVYTKVSYFIDYIRNTIPHL